jgi:hypothetical protein
MSGRKGGHNNDERGIHLMYIHLILITTHYAISGFAVGVFLVCASIMIGDRPTDGPRASPQLYMRR